MYYVVYLIDIDQFLVIPVTWMRDNEIYFERFVNYSLNNSQTHLCYWTSHVDAIRDGQPNKEFPPNLNAEIRNTFPCTERWYRCRIVKYKSKYRFCIDRVRTILAISIYYSMHIHILQNVYFICFF